MSDDVQVAEMDGDLVYSDAEEVEELRAELSQLERKTQRPRGGTGRLSQSRKVVPAEAEHAPQGEQEEKGEAAAPGHPAALGHKTVSAGPAALGQRTAANQSVASRPIPLSHVGSNPNKRWSTHFLSSLQDDGEWDHLLGDVGLIDTMERLSAYYQNNAILAGLLATVLFDTMASGKLFDLERGSLSCPVTGDASQCMLTKASYEPSQLKISHYIFYISGYLGLICLMCVIIVCVVTDNSMKKVTHEEELKMFLTDFSFSQKFVAPALYFSVFFLGVHFASLILVHMYFALNGMITAGASIMVPGIILHMSRTARNFRIKQKRMKAQKMGKPSNHVGSRMHLPGLWPGSHSRDAPGVQPSRNAPNIKEGQK